MPITEAIVGLVFVLLSLKLSVGEEYSFARAGIFFLLSALTILYGYFRNPFSPIYVFAFIAPIYSAFGTSFALILGGATLVLLRWKVAGWRHHFSWAGLAFCLWSIAGMIWGEQHYFGQDSFVAQILPPMALAIVIAGISSPLFRRNIVLLVVVACAIGSAFALRHYLQGMGGYGVGRTFALIRPDVFSAWEIFGFVGALVWLLDGNPSKWLRGVLFFCLIMIVAGIGLCGERAAIVASGLGLFLVCICLGRVRQGLIMVVVVAIGVLVLYVVEPEMFDPVLTRFQSVWQDKGSERLDIWAAALKALTDSPIIGVGTENFRFAIVKYYGASFLAHSIYIGTLLELGIVGFGLMLYWFAVLLRKAWRSVDRLWVFPILAVYLVEGLFLHEFYFSCFWLALALAEGARETKLADERQSSGLRSLSSSMKNIRARVCRYRPKMRPVLTRQKILSHALKMRPAPDQRGSAWENQHN